jgi:hypothetical protein
MMANGELDLSGLGPGEVADFCEHGNENGFQTIPKVSGLAEKLSVSGKGTLVTYIVLKYN